MIYSESQLRIEVDAVEYDLGNKGRLIVTGLQCRQLGLSGREVAERFDQMTDQGCPAELAREWAAGRQPEMVQ